MGEHYQISEMTLRNIAQNPVTDEIAIYDTDGIRVHKVTLLNQTTYEKKYTKRFSDSVTCISFSAKGNYLIVGTTAVNGTYVLNARTGAVVKRTSDSSGIISLAQTGPSEKTVITYSPLGTIVYYELQTMRPLKKLNTEKKLENVILFGNEKLSNRFLAGTKENSIYIIDATSGKIIGVYKANNPFIFSSKNDYDAKQGLYFTTYDGRNYNLKYISKEMLISQLTDPNANAFNPKEPLTIKNFIGLKSRDSFSYITKNANNVIMGTSSGNIYTMTDIPESETYTLFPVTENMYKKIYDIESDNEFYYLITNDTIYKTSSSKTIYTLGSNNGSTNLCKYNDNIILWTKNSRRPVSIFNIESKTISQLFTPEVEIRTLRVFDDKILYLLGSSIVGVYDLKSNEDKTLYKGTSIQDAVLLNENTACIAKTVTSPNDSALLSVNLNTMETVPLKFTGNVAFSLSYDYKLQNDIIYGITIKENNEVETTEVFTYNTSTNLYTAVLRLSDSDSTAFTSLKSPVVYTNLGKNRIYACNTLTKKNSSYKRPASIPVKIECTTNDMASLNHNGSISWYSASGQTKLSDWYLTVNGDWFEY